MPAYTLQRGTGTQAMPAYTLKRGTGVLELRHDGGMSFYEALTVITVFTRDNRKPLF